MTSDQETRHFIGTGEHDVLQAVWPGDNLLVRARTAEDTLRAALIDEVGRRTSGWNLPSLPPGFDVSQFVLGKVRPMVLSGQEHGVPLPGGHVHRREHGADDHTERGCQASQKVGLGESTGGMGTHMRLIFTVICTTMLTCAAVAESDTVPVIEESARAAFAGRPGALVMIDCLSGAVSVFAAESVAETLVPCSTFKIWNTLMGLECGIVSSSDQPFYAWDGERRSIAGWNRDLTLKEAFQVSCVPAFQDLARKIGAERMQMWVDKVGYGNRDTSAGVDVFWLPAPGRRTILISPQEQARLMYRLALGQVPFSAQSQSVLKEMMTVLKTDHRALYGKTGSSSGIDESPAVGWFVGYVESGRRKYAFACAVRGEGASGKVARDVVETVLQQQGLLPAPQ